MQHTLRLMRWQIQAAFCLLTDHLNINGQKTCRFLSVKLFLKRWLHWNITAATNGDKMKHINLGHQNCNQPTSHQPVQREEEIISSILFPELFQIKIHRSSKTLNYVLLLWFVTEQLNHVWCYCCPRLWWWFQCTVTRDGCVCSALAAVSDNCAGGVRWGGGSSRLGETKVCRGWSWCQTLHSCYHHHLLGSFMPCVLKTF